MSDWKGFIDENSRGISCINYGTGENALSDDWFNLISYIADNHKHITQAVTTNGTLAKRCAESEELFSIAVRALSEVDVSIDHACADKHDAIRRTPGAYDMALKTLQLCNENNIQSTIVLMGVDETLDIRNIEGIFGIAKKYGAYVRINIYRPVRENTGFSTPTLNTILSAMDWINDNHRIVSLSDPFFNATCTTSGYHADPSGVSSLRITQDGMIYPSTYLLKQPYCLGRITDTDIFEEIKKKTIVREIISADLPKECFVCSLRERCKGGAIDRRYLAGQNLMGRDPLCPKAFMEGEQLRKYNVYREGFHSVHDAYLPTLFFAPR